METKGYVIIFGLLAVAVALIWVGIEWHHTVIGVLALVAGIIAGLYWLFGLALPILGALNSDI